MDVLAVDALGQRLAEFRRHPEPRDLRALDLPCPLALAVITHQQQVLLGLNRWRRAWELPGGLIDGDESGRGAASRELREETGLAVDPRLLRWLGLAVFDLVDPDRRELAAVYTTDLADRPPVVKSEELIEVGWFDVAEPPAEHSPLDLAIAAAAVVR